MRKKANDNRAFQKKLAVERWENEGGGVAMPAEPNRTTSGERTKDMGQKNDNSIRTQVEEEFEAADGLGPPDMEQIENESNEPDFILQSPENSREDVDFTNIDADQLGDAFGLKNELDEPLHSVEKLQKRDEDRWSLKPESAEDFTGNVTSGSDPVE
jgi:hypothetical protein